jgi:hypothetical protein
VGFGDRNDPAGPRILLDRAFVNPVAWLMLAFFSVIIGAPIIGAAIWSLTTEKAHEMIWTPLKQWAGAHPLIFRTIVIALGCWVVSRWIWWLGWAGLMIWAGLLIVKHWRDPWVVPLWRWVVAKIQGARPYKHKYERAMQEDLTRSYGIEARTAFDAVALDTPEGDIQVASQRSAFNEEIARLLLVPKRSIAEEQRLLQIQRDVRRLDDALALRHASPQTLGHQRMARFGDVAQTAGGFLSMFNGPMLWIGGALLAWGVGATGVAWERGVRLDHVKDELHQQADAARAWRDRSRQQQTALNAAHEQSQASARTIEEERARSRAYAQRQERIRNEIRQVDAGGAAPTFGLRNAGDGAGDAASGGASGNSSRVPHSPS